MTIPPLIFEESQSPLYRSNDGRLVINHSRDHGDIWEIYLDDVFDIEPVFATRNRIAADAYIAGYDLVGDLVLDAANATKSSDVPPGGDPA